LAKGRVLVVDAEASVRLAVQKILNADGYEVAQADSKGGALDLFGAAPADAVIVDASLPDGDALDLISQVKGADPLIPCIVLASYESLERAALAIQQGAEQFLTKPLQLPSLLLVLQRVWENQQNRRRRITDEARRSRRHADPFCGSSAAVQKLAEQAGRVLEANSPVLIRGETGSGKGVLAGWLHSNGSRKEEPFLDLNCAGLSRELLESELFGHEKGAFTGAIAPKMGLLEVAHRGSLFLDEIGDMDLALQPKLLKALEEKRFRRLGDVRDRQVDVRLIAATHQDLSTMVEEKRFRGDLYFRISTLLLVIPPLRERTEDIPVLAECLLHDIAIDLDRPPIRLSEEALSKLQDHSWPGNIRELRNTLERGALSSPRNVLGPNELGFDFSAGTGTSRTPSLDDLANLTLAEAEKLLIQRALETERGRVDRAAQRLGISRSSLYQRIQKLGITVSRI
jgi:DNA-binding NtrC family response regulator